MWTEKIWCDFIVKTLFLNICGQSVGEGWEFCMGFHPTRPGNLPLLYWSVSYNCNDEGLRYRLILIMSTTSILHTWLITESSFKVSSCFLVPTWNIFRSLLTSNWCASLARRPVVLRGGSLGIPLSYYGSCFLFHNCRVRNGTIELGLLYWK